MSEQALAYITQILITVGITGWVYKTLKTSFENTISALRDSLIQSNLKIKDLETEVLKLQQSENKWYKKYYKLLLIFKTNKCTNKSCPVNLAIEKHLSEEGEV